MPGIRKAVEADAEALVGILEGIAAERIHSAIDQPWPAECQRDYIRRLSPREAIFVAEAEGEGVIGYQTLEQWAPSIRSMAHVAQIGTFLAPAWRGKGVGRALFQATVAFAREQGYAKFLIFVRGSNPAARGFYTCLGFWLCGCLAAQVRIDGQEDHEILMEYFL